jgi:hypothetical protein
MPERKTSRDIRAAGEVRNVGGAGVSLIRAPQQTAGLYVHDGVPGIILSFLRTGGGRLGLTLGGDQFEMFARPGDFLVSPADTTLACEHEAAMDLLLCLIPHPPGWITRRLRSCSRPWGAIGPGTLARVRVRGAIADTPPPNGSHVPPLGSKSTQRCRRCDEWIATPRRRREIAAPSAKLVGSCFCPPPRYRRNAISDP